ncbi:MAG: hypothetical protein D6696_15490 [Acidobacteria bacterium]|nr:MAG: hypothetical protein D6696_15490 [Acidobacteriota bacterium]
MRRAPQAETPPGTKIDHRELMKKVERAVAAIARADDVKTTIRTAIEHVVGSFGDELGISGGRLYEREGEEYVLRATFGNARWISPGLRIDRAYPPILRLLDESVVFLRAGDAGADAALEDQLGVSEFAAIAVGGERFLIAFDLVPGSDRDHVLFSLGIVRHAVNQALQREQFADLLRQVREIQASILPRQMPCFPPFDISGKSCALESVGGDLFDFIPVSDKILGLVVADVTGHGLPAALQVRDIYTGLRMGLARDFKIVRTIERLNRIIHESTLTSRFVSLFYCELERTGNLLYVNAGHPPPIHLAASGGVTYLDQGGPVLGPLPDATYDRGFVQMQPGDLMVAFTDGVTEARRLRAGDREGEEFGVGRLLAVLNEHRGQSAERLVDAIQQSLEAWCGPTPPQDDRTVVVVTYPAGDPGGAPG